MTTVYSKTSKGIRALNRKDRRLPANFMRVLALVDGKSTAEEISAKFRDVSSTGLHQALADLARDGYLKALASGSHAEFLSDPGMAADILVAETGEEDFFKELARIEARKTAREIAGQRRRGSAKAPAGEAGPIVEAPCAVAEKTGERAQEEAEEKARARARANRRLEARAREAAERKAREEAEARDKAEAVERARREAEEAARAEQAARVKAEAEARAREEAECMAREEAECMAREEAERRARAKAEAEARAEAEERARREAEEAARVERAAKAKALAEAERKAREKVEEEERERAEIEARARALADLRVLEEEKARQKAAANAKKARKPVEWGRMALVSLAVLVVLPLMLLHLVSLKAFIPAIEKMAEDRLHEPVAIGSMHVSLWPAPHLRLEEVTIGKARDVKIAAIRAMPELGALFEGAGTLKSIEVDGLLLDQDTLPRAVGWVGSGDARVSQIGLKDAKIALKDVPLPPLNADIALTAAGEFDRARIASADGKIEIEVAPKDGEFDVHLAAKNWQPPLGPRIIFEELTARATANREEMRIGEIRGRLFEGAAKGAATVKWGEFWTAEGQFTVSRIALEAATPALAGDIFLSGRLDAEAAYAMKAGSLAGLFDAPRIRASFSGRDGVVGNIDLARAVQARTAEAIKGGRTRFASLSGNMALADGRYQFRKMELSAGQFNAGGEVDVAPDRALSGKLDAEVKFKSNVIRARLALSGSLKQPALRRDAPVPARSAAVLPLGPATSP